MFIELQLMFTLLDKIPDGVVPMLKALEEHVVQAGLADMLASADVITQVVISFYSIVYDIM